MRASLKLLAGISLLSVCSLWFLWPMKQNDWPTTTKFRLPKPEMGNSVKETTYGIHSAVESTKFSWETAELTEEKLYELAHSAVKNSEIPKIIHQSWKSRDLETMFLAWSKNWQELHPNYTYILWTDDDNRLLVQKFYPWFLPAYDMFPRKIMRIDIVRCIYLYRYGGLYADLDVIPIKNHDSIYKEYNSYSVLLGSLSNDDDFEHNVPNAWMASKPGHDFWLLNLNLATQRAYSYPESAEGVTGPVLVKDCLLIWNRGKKHDIKLLEPGLIYGIDWRQQRPKPCDSGWELMVNQTRLQECLSLYPNIYALTVWTHSWE